MVRDSVPEIGSGHDGDCPGIAGFGVLGGMKSSGSDAAPSSFDHSPPIIGWREWLRLPELDIRAIKAKIDTGARSSSIHAYDIEPYHDGGTRRVRFKVHPLQRNETFEVACDAVVADVRAIRSSNGQSDDRFVIQTPVHWHGQTWTIDLTLAPRFEMGFRMLLGREAVRGRYLVDSGQSYFGPRPKKRKRSPKPSA